MALTITDARLEDSLDGSLEGSLDEVVGIRIDDGRIVAIGPDVVPADGDDVLDADGMTAIAGLVNGHGHAAMTLLRGVGGDLPLMRWLEDVIWPAEANLTADDVYWGTRLAALEMIRSGTVHFFDMYWQPGAVARAAEDAGMRATVGAPLFDDGDASRLPQVRETVRTSLDELAPFGPLITPSLTPHALYTVSAESLEFLAGEAADRDLIVHIHLSETRREVDEWMATHGERPTMSADALDLLGPRTILAHGCHLDQAELELIAERGATVVTNPVSNMKLAGGDMFPFPQARAAGVAVGLGTDGAASNNSLDLLADMKVFALVQKHTAGDPTVAPAAEVLALAQGRLSPLLGGRGLEVGAPGDVVLIDTTHHAITPGPFVDNLVYAASGAVVDATIVNGQVLMRGGHIDGADEVVARAREHAARLMRST